MEDKPDEDGFWPLYQSDLGSLGTYTAKPCMGSGYCCSKAPCFEGLRIHGPIAPCPSLREKDGRKWCGEMLDAEEKGDKVRARYLRVNLYVGSGCCMPLGNTERDRLVALSKKKGP